MISSYNPLCTVHCLFELTDFYHLGRGRRISTFKFSYFEYSKFSQWQGAWLIIAIYCLIHYQVFYLIICTTYTSIKDLISGISTRTIFPMYMCTCVFSYTDTIVHHYSV